MPLDAYHRPTERTLPPLNMFCLFIMQIIHVEGFEAFKCNKLCQTHHIAPFIMVCETVPPKKRLSCGNISHCTNRIHKSKVFSYDYILAENSLGFFLATTKKKEPTNNLE